MCQEPVWQPLPFSHSQRLSSSSWLNSAPQNHPQGQPTAATDKGAGGQRRSGSSVGSIWRLPMYTGRPGVIMLHDRFPLQGLRYCSLKYFLQAVWPNSTTHYTHHKHRKHQAWFTHGVQKQSLMNVVDNSNLGRQAMAEGRPPKV